MGGVGGSRGRLGGRGGGGEEGRGGRVGGGGGEGVPLPGLKGLCGCRRDGFRAVSVARVPHPELVPGGRRVSGEAGGVPQAEVPGVGGVLSRLPKALW